MTIIKEKANSVMAQRSGSVFVIDPVVIAILIQTVVALIKYFMDKKNPQKTLDKLREPGILNRMVIATIVWRNSTKETRQEVSESVKDFFHKTNVSELEAMFNEVN